MSGFLSSTERATNNGFILALPDLSESAEPFVLDMDASLHGIGAVFHGCKSLWNRQSSDTTSCPSPATSILDNLAAAVVEDTLEEMPSVDIRAAQKEDPDIKIVLSWYKDGSLQVPDQLQGVSKPIRRFCTELASFVVKDDLLLRVEEGHHLTVIPEALRNKAISTVHDITGGNQGGVERTVQKCKARFFWFGLSSDVRNYVQSCQICEQSTKGTTATAAPLESMCTGFNVYRV